MSQMKTRLPLYTPSLLDQNTLEAIFVKREPLLKSLLENHQQSVTTDNKHFSLFIGPRGIGKTHLLSLFFYRIQADPLLAEKTITAWLREEEWGIACYLDLLILTINSLKAELAIEDYQERID
jgi:DNA replication protein DnaC